MARYIMTPFNEQPVLASVMYLHASEATFLAMSKAMLSILDNIRNQAQASPFPIQRIQPIDTRYFDDADKFIGICIQDLIRNTRSYYEMWILRHMLRVVVMVIFRIDVAVFMTTLSWY